MTKTLVLNLRKALESYVVKIRTFCSPFFKNKTKLNANKSKSIIWLPSTLRHVICHPQTLFILSVNICFMEATSKITGEKKIPRIIFTVTAKLYKIIGLFG